MKRGRPGYSNEGPGGGRRWFAAAGAVLYGLACCCAAVPGIGTEAPATAAGVFSRQPEWKAVFRGVELAELEAETPREMRGFAVRIDGDAPGLEFVLTPSNGEREGETDGWKTSTFLKKTGCQVAINAAPFSPVHLSENKPQDVAGLLVNQGTVVSAELRPALVMERDGRARIVERPVRAEGLWNAVSGFGIVLRDGELAGEDKPLHPRTAAGVSRDGETVILLVIDGRQPGHSEGASTREVGIWLQALGAWDGLNLDGGGTTTLVIEDADGGAKVVNRTIHGGRPGLERVSASHLGVRAERLDGAAADPDSEPTANDPEP